MNGRKVNTIPSMLLKSEYRKKTNTVHWYWFYNCCINIMWQMRQVSWDFVWVFVTPREYDLGVCWYHKGVCTWKDYQSAYQYNAENKSMTFTAWYSFTETVQTRLVYATTVITWEQCNTVNNETHISLSTNAGNSLLFLRCNMYWFYD